MTFRSLEPILQNYPKNSWLFDTFNQLPEFYSWGDFLGVLLSPKNQLYVWRNFQFNFDLNESWIRLSKT